MACTERTPSAGHAPCLNQADPSLSKSLGLLGMRERAAILGGRVNVTSAPGKGTTVTAWIPLASSEESGTIPAAIP